VSKKIEDMNDEEFEKLYQQEYGQYYESRYQQEADKLIKDREVRVLEDMYKLQQYTWLETIGAPFIAGILVVLFFIFMAIFFSGGNEHIEL
jgi:hypothetical protein